MTFIGAFAARRAATGASLSGILGIIAGIIVLTYPISSAVTLALIAGIWLVILGIMQIVAGIQLRDASGSRNLGGAPPPPEPDARGPADRPASVLSCRAAPTGAHDALGRGLARDPASFAPA